MSMLAKIPSEDFIFDLLRNHLPHDDEAGYASKPLTNREYVIALLLVTAFLVLLILGFRVLIT